jgi:NAD(P)-dependent dehydrogenase (short-subunit alcohol dehydrogenase family)
MDTMIVNTSDWSDVFTPIVNSAAEKARERRHEAKAIDAAKAYSQAKAAINSRKRELIKTIATTMMVVVMVLMTTITTARWVASLPRKVEAPEGLKKIYISEVVRPGDTIDGFVAKYMADESANVSLYRFQDLRAEIVRVNDIVNPDRIYLGQKIQIPVIVVDENWSPEEEVNQ